MIKSLSSARDGSADTTFIDIDLGRRRLNTYSGCEKTYWTTVRDRVRLLVKCFKHCLTQLILTGSSAGDGRFEETVQDALYDLVSATTLDVLRTHCTGLGADDKKRTGDDLLYATAKGAAGIAKRRQEGPVRCAESEACKRFRRGIE